MKQFTCIILTIFSFQLFGQNYEFSLENVPANNNIITFPNLDSSEVSAISFNKDIDYVENILWIMNIETNELTSKRIPKYILGNIVEAKNLSYHKDHIFCLKRTSDGRSLAVQPIALKENTITKKPQFINLSKFKKEYIASKFNNGHLYIFTVSRRKKMIKIYKVDLDEDNIEVMDIPAVKGDFAALNVGVFKDESNFTRVIDVKEFNHPNQLLIKNKIYIEEDKIILLLQSLEEKYRSIVYSIDYGAKTYERKSLLFSKTNVNFNTAYHDNYIYRFSGSHSNMIVEKIGLDSTKKSVRYLVDKKNQNTPFQKNTPKIISFTSTGGKYLTRNYITRNFLKKPMPRHIHQSICLLEYEGDDLVVYVGYTPLDVQQTSYNPNFGGSFQYFSPGELDYYLMETNLSSKEDTERMSKNEKFRTPTFVKIIASCHDENKNPKEYNPTRHKYKLIDEIADVQIHRVENNYYGSFFDSSTNIYHFRKLNLDN